MAKSPVYMWLRAGVGAQEWTLMDTFPQVWP